MWRSAIVAAGLEPGPVVFADPLALPGEDVTAIVHTSDVLAAAALPAAHARGISITGFDDSPLAALASPPITSVRVDYAQFGEAAAAALLAVIAGEPVPAFAGSEPELVARASTAPRPGS